MAHRSSALAVGILWGLAAGCRGTTDAAKVPSELSVVITTDMDSSGGLR